MKEYDFYKHNRDKSRFNEHLSNILSQRPHPGCVMTIVGDAAYLEQVKQILGEECINFKFVDKYNNDLLGHYQNIESYNHILYLENDQGINN